MSGTLIAIIAVVLLVIILAYVISASNRFKRLQIKIKEAESGIDVALTKRYDTLTKMLSATRGFAKHEQETLLKSIQMRQNMPIGEKMEADYKIGQAAKSFMALSESYPELKSDAVFAQLQHSIMDTEEHLQASRRLYNSNVSAFNQAIAVFPGSIIAGIGGFTQQPMYQAEIHQRQDVEMSF